MKDSKSSKLSDHNNFSHALITTQVFRSVAGYKAVPISKSFKQEICRHLKIMKLSQTCTLQFTVAKNMVVFL